MIKGKCKYCGSETRFTMQSKMSEMMYCSDDCWKKDWIRNGDGLVHPDCKNVILSHANKYGSREIVEEAYKKISNVSILKP